jgi:hypothetical protein
MMVVVKAIIVVPLGVPSIKWVVSCDKHSFPMKATIILVSVKPAVLLAVVRLLLLLVDLIIVSRTYYQDPLAHR